MPKRKRVGKPAVRSEKAIQNWLQSIIAKGQLRAVIAGESALDDALKDSESPEWWPSFPIDYLTRLRVLQAARSVLDELYDLTLVSSSARSISRTKNETLYADLLYSQREGSRFVVIEIKKEHATARETITELLAYEHEILNHIPFASSHDILMVIVSPEFSPLLDHAVTGLVTWNRRRVLCLRVDNWESAPVLQIHLPASWAAVGQSTLPSTGIQTAYLCPYPNAELTRDQVFAVCETAATILSREAERTGSSGFVMVVEDHFYPEVTQSPFSIIAGVVNPYCFLPDAEASGFVTSTSSSIASYLLSDDTRQELTASWEWTSAGGTAAAEYLKSFGNPMWEGFSNWDSFRDPRRWRSDTITADRHVCPISIDFWGVVGDFARDFVIHGARVRNFMPGYLKPGLDWRSPHLGVMLLDEISVEPVVKNGEWTFEAIFSFGIRLGRLGAISATFADSDADTRRKLQAGLFWAEADLVRATNEMAWRYLAANEVNQPPPRIPIGLYDSSEKVMERLTAFADWVLEHFIGSNFPLLQQAFFLGLRVYPLYDKQFDPFGTNPEIGTIREQAEKIAREWLRMTVQEFQWSGKNPNHDELRSAVTEVFGTAIPCDKSLQAAIAAIDALDPTLLIDKLFRDIPSIVSEWHPQLMHTLADMAKGGRDWDWYELQVRERRERGVKNPCICLTPGGQMGVGQLPDGLPVPLISDPAVEVLFADNRTFAEIVVPVKWEDLRAGRLPSFSIKKGGPT